MGYVLDVTHAVPPDANVCGTSKDETSSLLYLSSDMVAHYLTNLHPLPNLWCEQKCSWYYVVYLNLRSGVFDKTSSPIWDNWYFPVFVLRYGSLILQYMASLMVLTRLSDSLSTMKKLSSGMVTCDVGVVINGGRCPECSF